MHEEPPLKPEWLDAWPVEPPAKSFDDRVWRAFERRKYTARLLKGLVFSAAAAAFAGVVFSSGEAALESDALFARGRTTWLIADRAVAVAEDGSRLSWSHREGVTHVTQESGDVFYRVDRGGPFKVFTPMGSVRALGTCFRVRVEKMDVERQSPGGMGTVASHAVLVTVYEGRVALSDRRSLGPGKTAALGQGSSIEPDEEAPASARDGEPTPLEAAQNQIRTQSDEIRRLSAELAELRKAEQARPESPPSAWRDHALEARFEVEVRDETWAAGEEELLAERMTRYMSVPREKLFIECRSNCCDIQLDIDGRKMGSLLGDFKSSVGIGIGITHWVDMDVLYRTESRDGLHHVFACSTRATGEHNMPDRGLEREQLLARAAPALELCRSSLRGPLDVELQVNVDPHGAISHVRTTANPAGESATKCVEQALLSAAQFEPASHGTWFPIRVTLQGL